MADFERLRFAFVHRRFEGSVASGVLALGGALLCLAFTAGPLFNADGLFSGIGPQPATVHCGIQDCEAELTGWFEALPAEDEVRAAAEARIDRDLTGLASMHPAFAEYLPDILDPYLPSEMKRELVEDLNAEPGAAAMLTEVALLEGRLADHWTSLPSRVVLSSPEAPSGVRSKRHRAVVATLARQEVLAYQSAVAQERSRAFDEIEARSGAAVLAYTESLRRRQSGLNHIPVHLLGWAMALMAMVLFRRSWLFRPFLVHVDRHAIRVRGRRVPLGDFDEFTLQGFLAGLHRRGHRVRPRGLEAAVVERSVAQRRLATPGPEEKAALEALAAQSRKSRE